MGGRAVSAGRRQLRTAHPLSTLSRSVQPSRHSSPGLFSITPSAGDREDTLVEMSFYVPRDNEDFAAPKPAVVEGEQAEDGEAAAAAVIDPPAKVLFDMVSQFTDAGGRAVFVGRKGDMSARRSWLPWHRGRGGCAPPRRLAALLEIFVGSARLAGRAAGAPPDQRPGAGTSQQSARRCSPCPRSTPASNSLAGNWSRFVAFLVQAPPPATRWPPLTRSACWCRAAASTSRCTCRRSSLWGRWGAGQRPSAARHPGPTLSDPRCRQSLHSVSSSMPAWRQSQLPFVAS